MVWADASVSRPTARRGLDHPFSLPEQTKPSGAALRRSPFVFRKAL